MKEYTQKIDAASQHLLGLINDVLDMNKIESGSAVLNISELDLAEVISELNTIIRPQARSKDQTFEIHTDSLNCERLLGDKLRINQIMINILSNAVKYTPSGGAVTLQAISYELFCRINVTDTGPGISEEEQPKIFQRFYRAASDAEGVGIGLYLAREIVTRQGGYIKVDSEVGRGSTFSVFLPRR